MTRLQIRTHIRKKLGETTAAFWTNDQLNAWINDAGRDIAFRTKCIRTSGYISSVEDTQEYSVTANFSNYLSVLKVYFYQDGSTWEKLDNINYEDLDNLKPGWKSYDSGTPTEYYWDREDDVLGLVVKPNSTNAGANYVQVYYANGFTDLADDSETPGIPAYLHMAIVDYVVSLGFEQRGYGDKAAASKQVYEDRLQKYLAERQREREDEEIIMKNYRNI